MPGTWRVPVSFQSHSRPPPGKSLKSFPEPSPSTSMCPQEICVMRGDFLTVDDIVPSENLSSPVIKNCFPSAQFLQPSALSPISSARLLQPSVFTDQTQLFWPSASVFRSFRRHVSAAGFPTGHGYNPCTHRGECRLSQDDSANRRPV